VSNYASCNATQISFALRRRTFSFWELLPQDFFLIALSPALPVRLQLLRLAGASLGNDVGHLVRHSQSRAQPWGPRPRTAPIFASFPAGPIRWGSSALY